MIFFRKNKQKKENGPAPAEQPSLSDDEKQRQIVHLRNQLDRLEQQIGGNKEPRNQSLQNDEVKVHYSRDSSKAYARKPRQSVAEIAINKDTSEGTCRANGTWMTSHGERSSSIASKSITSDHGDGEIFYKDGKKYRRVVRMVRPVSKDTSPLADTPTLFRSSSSAHGRKEVTDGHVQAMTARFSMNSVTSDVSMNSRVSSASKPRRPSKPIRVRTVAKSYPLLSPTQNNEPETQLGQTKRIPDPSSFSSDNPWMRNKLVQQGTPKTVGPSSCPSTPAAIGEWMINQSYELNANKIPTNSVQYNRPVDSPYQKPFATPKKATFQPGIFTPSQKRNDSCQVGSSHDRHPQAIKSVTKEELLLPCDEPSGIVKGNTASKAAVKASCTPPFPRENPSMKLNDNSRSKTGLRGSRNLPLVKDVSPKKPSEKVASTTRDEESKASAPWSWKFPFTKPEKETPPPTSMDLKREKKSPPPALMGRRTQPVSLLDQIEKPDVQLKKIPDAPQKTSIASANQFHSGPSSSGAPGPTKRFHPKTGAHDPSALLAGIRAGVPLKKVEKTKPASTKHVSTMTRMLAELQEKKAECLRREQEGDRNEIDW